MVTSSTLAFFSNSACTTAASNMPDVVSAPLDQFFGPMQCLDSANGAPKDTDDLSRFTGYSCLVDPVSSAAGQGTTISQVTATFVMKADMATYNDTSAEADVIALLGNAISASDLTITRSDRSETTRLLSGALSVTKQTGLNVVVKTPAKAIALTDTRSGATGNYLASDSAAQKRTLTVSGLRASPNAKYSDVGAVSFANGKSAGLAPVTIKKSKQNSAARASPLATAFIVASTALVAFFF